MNSVNVSTVILYPRNLLSLFMYYCSNYYNAYYLWMCTGVGDRRTSYASSSSVTASVVVRHDDQSTSENRQNCLCIVY